MTASALLAWALSAGGQALAMEVAGTPMREDALTALGAARLVSDSELAALRGGFFTASGAQFDFGASIRTMVNGQLALQTDLKWTPTGPVMQQLTGLGAQIQSQVNNSVARSLAQAGSASPLPTAGATQTVSAPPTIASVPAAAASSVASSASSAAAVAPSPSPDTIPAIAAAAAPSSSPSIAPAVTAAVDPSTLVGVQVPGQGGATQVFANIGSGQIQNIIMNSANGQTITQNTNIMLTIYNFQAWQAQLANHMAALRLASDVLAASGLSAGH